MNFSAAFKALFSDSKSMAPEKTIATEVCEDLRGLALGIDRATFSIKEEAVNFDNLAKELRKLEKNNPLVQALMRRFEATDEFCLLGSYYSKRPDGHPEFSGTSRVVLSKYGFQKAWDFMDPIFIETSELPYQTGDVYRIKGEDLRAIDCESVDKVIDKLKDYAQKIRRDEAKMEAVSSEEPYVPRPGKD